MLAVVVSDTRLDPLDPLEDAAFRLLAGTDAADADADRRVLSVLSKIHRRNSLRCDCVAGEAPQACAVRLPTGDLILRWYNGIPHATTCPFYREPSSSPEPSKPAARPPAGGRAFKPWDGGWSILGDAIDRPRIGAGQGAEPRPKSTPSYTSLPRLGRVLLSALHRCGYDQVSVHELVDKGEPRPSHPDRWAKRIYRLLDEPAGPELSFKDTGTLQLSQLSNWLTRYLPRVAPRFGALRPQGVLIDRVDHIEQRGPREAILTGFGGDPLATVTIATTVRHFGVPTTGPYWVALLASRASPDAGFDVIDAYAHPAYRSDLPIPVDSAAERAMLDILLDQLRFWRRYPKTDASVSLTKPLFDLDSPLGPCRPDAVLAMAGPRGRPLQLIVECMGSEDLDYLASKQVTHPRMLQLPDVVGLVQFHPDLAEADFRRTLTRSLFQATRTPQT